MGKALGVMMALLSVSLTGCGGYSPLYQPDVKEWIAQKNQEQADYDRVVSETQVARLKKERDDASQFEASHPEVSIGKIDVSQSLGSGRELAVAMNSLDFVTRYPGAQTLDNVYVKVGSYELTLRRLQIAVAGYADECKRISAYNNTDYKDKCLHALSVGVKEFSGMLKNANIPNKTKVTALEQASYGSYIDFEHAARLASMHFKLCKQKSDQGYVEMATVAAPCSGHGDVLNLYAARRAGVL